MRPARACCAYATPPAATIRSRKATHALYALPPLSTCRTQPFRNSRMPDMGASSRRVEVVELRVGGELLLEDEDALRLHHLADLALGVEEVAELARADGADLHARGVAAVARALDAERALLHDALRPRPVPQVVLHRVQLLGRELRLRPVHVARAVRARRHAAAAADAPIVVDDDDAVRLLPRRLRRADLHARWVAALLALHREVELAGARHRVGLVVQLGVGEVDAVLLL